MMHSMATTANVMLEEHRLLWGLLISVEAADVGIISMTPWRRPAVSVSRSDPTRAPSGCG